MKKILISHSFCSTGDIVIKTHKTIEEINLIVFLIQYIECDLPSIQDSGDGIYQEDLKYLLLNYDDTEVEDFSNQEYDYELNIFNNWEWGGYSKFEEHRVISCMCHSFTEDENKEFDKQFHQKLFSVAYIDNLELLLVEHRLKQIKDTNVEDFEIFTKIKNALVNNDFSFYWNGWCGRDIPINATLLRGAQNE